MGELADDMLDGFSCSYCGIYFQSPHGYPVLCRDCKEDAEPDDPLQKATHPELGEAP
jgi:hypothetical protein